MGKVEQRDYDGGWGQHITIHALELLPHHTFLHRETDCHLLAVLVYAHLDLDRHLSLEVQ